MDAKGTATSKIWVVNGSGVPLIHLAKDEPFSVVVTVPDIGQDEDPVRLTIEVGDQSTTVDAPYTGRSDGVVSYWLEGQRLDDDTVLFDGSEHSFSVENGEPITIFGADGSAVASSEPFKGFAYETEKARDAFAGLIHLEMVFETWLAFRFRVRQLPQQSAATQQVVDDASMFLLQLKFGLEAMRRYTDGNQYDQYARAAAVAEFLIDDIPSDPLGAIEQGLRPYLLYKRPDAYLGLINLAVDTYENRVEDQFAHTLVTATVASYRGFVQYSGVDVGFTGATSIYAKYDALRSGDDDWLTRTGIDELGVPKSDAALLMDVLADLALKKVVDATAVHMTGGRDLEFIKPSARPASAPGRVAPSSGVGSRIELPGSHGVRPDVMPGFLKVAREYDVVMVMRPGNQDSMGWQALGHPGKDTRLKTKTVKKVDGYIGGPEARYTGLVGSFDPTLPTRPPHLDDAAWDRIVNGGRRPPEMTNDVEWTTHKDAWAEEVTDLWGDFMPDGVPAGVVDQMIKRFVQRRLEFEDNAAWLGKLEQQGLIRIENGLIVDTGIYGATGKAITGDYDLFQILNADGTRVSPELYRKVLEALGRDPNLYVLHGAHMWWPVDAPFAPGSKDANIYHAIMEGHVNEALLLIGLPDGLLRTTNVRDGQLITSRQGDGGAPFWGGLVIRPSSVEAAAHAGPLSLDRVQAAASMARRLPLDFLADRKQGDASPPLAVPSEGVGELSPEEKAANQRAYEDRMIEVAASDVKPVYQGPEFVIDDDGVDQQARPSALIEEAWLNDPDSLRPHDDPASWEPDGRYEDVLACYEFHVRCESCQDSADAVAKARATVVVLEADLKRLQSLLVEYPTYATEIAAAIQEVAFELERARKEIVIRLFILEECEERCDNEQEFTMLLSDPPFHASLFPPEPDEDCCDACRDEAVALRFAKDRLAALRAGRPAYPSADDESPVESESKGADDEPPTEPPPRPPDHYDGAIADAQMDLSRARIRLYHCKVLLCGELDHLPAEAFPPLTEVPGYDPTIDGDWSCDCVPCIAISHRLAMYRIYLRTVIARLVALESQLSLHQMAGTPDSSENRDRDAARNRAVATVVYHEFVVSDLEEILKRCVRERCPDPAGGWVDPPSAATAVPEPAGPEKGPERKIPLILGGVIVGFAVAGTALFVALSGGGDEPLNKEDAAVVEASDPSIVPAVTDPPSLSDRPVGPDLSEGNDPSADNSDTLADAGPADEPAPPGAGPSAEVVSQLAGPDGAAVGVVVKRDPEGGLSWSIVGTDGQPLDATEIEQYWSMIVTYASDAVDRLFNFSSYPCNTATDDFIVTCALGAGTLLEGDYVVVGIEHRGQIADGPGQFTYGLAFDDDGDESDNFRAQPPYDADFFDNTEYWYTLQIDADGARSMWADGIRDGALGYPRYSAAAAIEFGTTLVWVIPRDELRGAQLGFRATAFHNDGDVGAAPDPATSGGDVTGFGVDDPLTPVPLAAVAFDDLSGVPPDIDDLNPRVQVIDDQDTHLTAALIGEFSNRISAALAADDPEAVVELLHPLQRDGPTADDCRATIERTIAQAESIDITPSGNPPDTSAVSPVYSALATINYPTGSVEWDPFLTVGPGGRLYLVLPSCT